MSIENRPFAGTWRLDGRKLIQHTPDALVYLNGDTSVPGCPKCNGRIDIQQFLTEVSVDAGTDPNGASSTLTLSIPLHHTDSLSRDGQFILRPGMEIHVYMRGYFPVKGMYSKLSDPVAVLGVPLSEAGALAAPTPTPTPSRDMVKNAHGLNSAQRKNALLIYDMFGKANIPPAVAMAAIANAKIESGLNASQPQHGATTNIGLGLFQLKPDNGMGAPNPKFMGGRTAGTTAQATADSAKYYDAYKAENNIARMIVNMKDPAFGGKVVADANNGASINDLVVSFLQHAEVAGTQGQQARQAAARQMFGDLVDVPHPDSHGESSPGIVPAVDPSRVTPDGVRLDQYGLEDDGIEDVLAYPYYHVFHGVVTNVSHSYSGGAHTVTIQSASMLHFWQYHTMSTNAALFGARAPGSKLRTSMVGHNFTGMHPYEIMWTLHTDVAGAAAGVSWALSQKQNQTAKNEVANESNFGLYLKYWEHRFNQGIVHLRMHGMTGELFSTLQAEFLGRTSSSALTKMVRDRFVNDNSRSGQGSKIMAATQVLFSKHDKAALRGDNQAGNNELILSEMQAFVSDLSQMGQPAMFESVYESKLDLAIKVCEVTGFEFFQDVDGDFVFKPPMYNLDTSSSRVYRIEDEDIISISFDEGEPAVTLMTVKGSPYKNTKGTGLENEWGVQGQYIDYRLVAQFGWRPQSFETSYYNDPKAMFFAAVNRMDVLNAPVKKATVSIPVRPELRPGYPVYIPYLDCFYYVQSFSHAHNFGGECTTSIQLIAKRAKFYAPGYPNKTGIDAIDLATPQLPGRPLQVLGQDQRTRMAGFPNVVMALDTTKINPMFLVVGNDSEKLDSPERIEALLEMAKNLGVVTEDPPDSGIYVMREPGVSEGGDKTPVKITKVFTLETPSADVLAAAKVSDASVTNLASAGKSWDKAQEDLGKAMADKKEKLHQAYLKWQALDKLQKAAQKKEGA